MSLSALKNEKVSGIWNHKLRDKEFIALIKNGYHSFLMLNYGPNSGITAIQNSAGRFSFSASSSVILQQLQFLHPSFKFINALVNAQNKTYGNNGLFVGLLCSGLLYRFLDLVDIVSFRLIKELSDWIIMKLMSEVQLKNNKLLIRFDFSCIDHILCIIKSSIKSKVFNIILKEETDHLCLIVMQCFIKSLPHERQEDFSHLHISTIEGPSSLNSQVFEGVLYTQSDFSLETLDRSLRKIPKSHIKIVIFNVPLSCNMDENFNFKWKDDKHLETSYNEHLVQKLSKYLLSKGIHIIANQKYIDASIKIDLEKYGFLVLERLGTRLTSSLTKMCKCVPLTSVAEIEASENTIGNVYCIRAVEIEKKPYLHLNSENSSQSLTLILTGYNCHILEYLKEVVESCINLLQHSIVNDSSVICGGGCLEAFISFKLAKILQEHALDLSKQFQTSRTKIYKVFQVFIDTFLQLSIKPSGGNAKHLIDYSIDSSFNHLWLIDNQDISNGATIKEEPSSSERLQSEVDLNKMSFDKIVSSKPVNSVVTKKPFSCICKSILYSDLPKDVHFIPLTFLKNEYKPMQRTEDAKISSEVDKLFNSTDYKISLRKDSLVDYWPAKQNALRMAFDGFSELFQIGYCIFDK